MKSEPDCYSIDDLKKANGPAMWEGCRNYVVRNYFRDEMGVGDKAFFYHSSTNPPGIVGTMEIVSDALPDPSPSLTPVQSLRAVRPCNPAHS